MLYQYLIDNGSVGICQEVDTHSNPDTQQDLVEWAIASHGMYKSTLVFIAILK